MTVEETLIKVEQMAREAEGMLRGIDIKQLRQHTSSDDCKAIYRDHLHSCAHADALADEAGSLRRRITTEVDNARR